MHKVHQVILINLFLLWTFLQWLCEEQTKTVTKSVFTVHQLQLTYRFFLFVRIYLI